MAKKGKHAKGRKNSKKIQNDNTSEDINQGESRENKEIFDDLIIKIKNFLIKSKT